MATSAFSFPEPSSASAVIACLSSTPEAQDVATAAANYARWLDRPLILFHSLEFERTEARMPDPLEWLLWRGKALRQLEEERDRLDDSGSIPSLELGEGDWIEALSYRLQSISDPVVVIGANPDDNTAHLVSTLLQNGADKVFVVPAGFHAASENPLLAVPLDGSLFSEAALAQAIAIAKSRPSELLLVHVMPFAGIDSFGPLAERDRELRSLVERRNETVACSFLETTLRRLRDMGLKARSCCLKGDPRSCLANLLASEAPELVMLSARGQGIRSCEDLAIGSTANYLLDHLHLPVMLVGSSPGESRKKGTEPERHRQALEFRGPLNSSPVAA